MQVKNRHMQAKASKILENFPALLIIGSRQTGKTVLSKMLGKEWKYYDLENRDHYELISSDPQFFFKKHSEKLIIDEAQKFPELFETLRGVIDRDREVNGRFILTGSSSPELLKSTSESLAGRIGIIELGTLKCSEFIDTPLSPFYEILDGADIQKIVDKSSLISTQQELFNFWFFGGYPKPIIDFSKDSFELWMNSYVDTYINRDLKSLFPKLNSIRYQKFIAMLSNMTGTIINKRDFAKSLDVSEPTIKDYIKIADQTFLWRMLTSFEHNVKKEVTKMPKGHMRDSGLVHHLLKIKNLDALESHPIIGRSFESFIIEEVIKGIEANSVYQSSYHYYRTRSGAEIDLIVHNKHGVFPIEIKYGTRTTAKSLITLNNFIKEHNLPFGILINNSDKIEWRNEKIIQFPACYL